MQPITTWSLGGLNTQVLFAYARIQGQRQNDLSAWLPNFARQLLGKLFTPESAAPGAGGGGDGQAGEEVYKRSPLAATGNHHRPPLSPAAAAQAILLAQQLYYRVLQHILARLHPMSEVLDGSRFRRLVISQPEEAHRKLRCPDLHLGLLTVAAELVCAALSEEHRVLSSLDILGTTHSALAIWDATRWFLECFGEAESGAAGAAAGQPQAAAVVSSGAAVPTSKDGTSCVMAPRFVAILRYLRRRCEEQLVLADGSNFFEATFTGGGGMYAAGDMRLVSAFISSLGQTVAGQALQLGGTLTAAGALEGGPMDPMDFVHAVVELADTVMMQRLDLFFNQHSALITACVAYGVAKVMRLEISFRTIINAAAQALPGVTPSLFQAVYLPSSTASTLSPSKLGPGGTADIRVFYNSCFLPSCDTFIRALHRSYSSRLRIAPPPAGPVSHASSAATLPGSDGGLPASGGNPNSGETCNATKAGSMPGSATAAATAVTHQTASSLASGSAGAAGTAAVSAGLLGVSEEQGGDSRGKHLVVEQHQLGPPSDGPPELALLAASQAMEVDPGGDEGGMDVDEDAIMAIPIRGDTMRLPTAGRPEQPGAGWAISNGGHRGDEEEEEEEEEDEGEDTDPVPDQQLHGRQHLFSLGQLGRADLRRQNASDLKAGSAADQAPQHTTRSLPGNASVMPSGVNKGAGSAPSMRRAGDAGTSDVSATVPAATGRKALQALPPNAELTRTSTAALSSKTSAGPPVKKSGGPTLVAGMQPGLSVADAAQGVPVSSQVHEAPRTGSGLTTVQELWQAGAVAPASGGGQVQVQARHQQRPR